MEITEVIRYKFGGKEYNSLHAIKTDIENQIGGIIDEIFNICPPAKASNKIKILEYLTNKTTRDKIIRLLSVTFEKETEFLQGDSEVNILDL